MVGPHGIVVSPFRPTSRIEGRGPHHHVEAARRWCNTWLFLTTPSPARFLRFPRKNWLFPVLSAVNWLDFAATDTTQPSFVFLPMQDKKEEFFMQRLRTPSAGSDSSPPWLSRIRVFPARHLQYYFFHFWPLVQTLGRGRTVWSPWSSFTPPSLGRGRVAPPPPTCRHIFTLSL